MIMLLARSLRIVLCVVILVMLFPSGSAQALTATFSNSAPIAINDDSSASPYPSSIAVSGFTGTITRVMVTLNNFSHTYAADLDILLVGPGGQAVVLLSDVGAANDYVHATITFDDAGASIPSINPIPSGTYRPTVNGVGDTYPAPAPGGVRGSALAFFTGTNPNGTWQLYVNDDNHDDSGAISGGWDLTVTVEAATPADPGVAPPWNPGDGRLNPEQAAPLSIYCDADSIYAYIPDYLEFDFPRDQIGAAGVTTLLTTGVTGARLYRLDTGEFQVNFLHGSEEYVFTWDACPATRAITRVYNSATHVLLAEYARTY